MLNLNNTNIVNINYKLNANPQPLKKTVVNSSGKENSTSNDKVSPSEATAIQTDNGPVKSVRPEYYSGDEGGFLRDNTQTVPIAVEASGLSYTINESAVSDLEQQFSGLYDLSSEFLQNVAALTANYKADANKDLTDSLLNTIENKLTGFNTQSLSTIDSLQLIMAKNTHGQSSSGLIQDLTNLVANYQSLPVGKLSGSELQNKLISFANQVDMIIRGNSNTAMSLELSVSGTDILTAIPTAVAVNSVPGSSGISSDAAISQSSQSINHMLGGMDTTKADPLFLGMVICLYMATLQSQVIVMNLKMLSANKTVTNLFTAASTAFLDLKQAFPITVTKSGSSTPINIPTLYGAFQLAFGTAADYSGSVSSFTAMHPTRSQLQADLMPMYNLLKNIDPTDMAKFSTTGSDGWSTANATYFNQAVTNMYNYINNQILLLSPTLQTITPLPVSNGSYLLYSSDSTTETDITNDLTETQTALQSVSSSASSTSSQLVLVLQSNQSQYGNLMSAASSSLSSLKALFRGLWTQ